MSASSSRSLSPTSKAYLPTTNQYGCAVVCFFTQPTATFQELEKNIEKVKGLLQTIKEQVDKLRPLASDTQKAAMDKVGDWLNDVNNFKQKVGE